MIPLGWWGNTCPERKWLAPGHTGTSNRAPNWIRFIPRLHPPSTGIRLLREDSNFSIISYFVLPRSHPGLDEVERGPGVTHSPWIKLSSLMGKKVLCKCLLVGSLTLCTSLLPLELKVMLAQIKSKTGLLHLCAHTAGPNLVSRMQSILIWCSFESPCLSFPPPSTEAGCSCTSMYLSTRGSNRAHQWLVDLEYI